MIKLNLLLIEHMTLNADTIDYGKLKTISSIKELLSQIDYTVEAVPTNDTNKMLKLLTSLKGESLTKKEIELLKEISNPKYLTEHVTI